MRQKRQPIIDASGQQKRGQEFYEQTLHELQSREAQQRKEAQIRSKYM